MSVALSQPQRKGDRDPLRESPLGQFVLRHDLDRLCYDAALDFARLTRRVFRNRTATGTVRLTTG
jgi:hypothetical protein